MAEEVAKGAKDCGKTSHPARCEAIKAAKEACKDKQADIKDIYSEVKSHGLPVRAVRGVVKYRDLERKQAAIADKLDIDEASTYQALVDALGDLGRAAAERAGVVVNLAR